MSRWFIAAVAALTANAVAQNDLEVKGLLLGGTQADMKRVHGERFECKPSDDETRGQVVCRFRVPGTNITIGGTQIKTISLGYFGERLGLIYMLVDEAEFLPLGQAMIDRYGKPREDTFPITTRAGVRLTNEMLTWDRQSLSIKLVRYAATIEHSYVEYVTPDAQTAIAAARAEARKARARDF